MKSQFQKESKSNTLPPVIFVHGANHGTWCWQEKFVPFFESKGFLCKCVSLSGHDKNNDSSPSLDVYMKDVLEVIEETNEKPVLIGHSMGGAIVQKILYGYSDKIKSAVLLASVAPNGMLRDFIRIMFTRPKQMFKLLAFNNGKNKVFPMELFFSKDLSESEKKKYCSLLIPESQNASKECIKSIIPLPVIVKNPVLVIGSKSDVMISEKSVTQTAKVYNTYPNLYEDISHDMMLDLKWEMVANNILDFVIS